MEQINLSMVILDFKITLHFHFSFSICLDYKQSKGNLVKLKKHVTFLKLWKFYAFFCKSDFVLNALFKVWWVKPTSAGVETQKIC